MKRRFIWVWTATSDQSGWGPFWGTCREWAAETRAAGLTLTSERRLWLGTPPGCHDPSHRHATGSFTP